MKCGGFSKAGLSKEMVKMFVSHIMRTICIKPTDNILRNNSRTRHEMRKPCIHRRFSALSLDSNPRWCSCRCRQFGFVPTIFAENNWQLHGDKHHEQIGTSSYPLNVICLVGVSQVFWGVTLGQKFDAVSNQKRKRSLGTKWVVRSFHPVKVSGSSQLLSLLFSFPTLVPNRPWLGSNHGGFHFYLDIDPRAQGETNNRAWREQGKRGWDSSKQYQWNQVIERKLRGGEDTPCIVWHSLTR